MFKQCAIIYFFGMQDVNASFDIFNDMSMLKMNEVTFRWFLRGHFESKFLTALESQNLSDYDYARKNI